MNCLLVGIATAGFALASPCLADAQAALATSRATVMDTERPPALVVPSRTVRIAVNQPHPSVEQGPPMGILGGGISLLVAAQLFPFMIAASAGDYWFALPLVPEVIEGYRRARNGVFLDPIVAGICFIDAAIQAAGLGMSIAGSILRVRSDAARNGSWISRWSLTPLASTTGVGLSVGFANW